MSGERGASHETENSRGQRVLERWVQGDWAALARMAWAAPQPDADPETCARLTSSLLHAGDASTARNWAKTLATTEAERQILIRTLLSSAHQSLGRARYFSGTEERAAAHFERGLSDIRPLGESRRLVPLRLEEAAAALERRVEVARGERSAGMDASTGQVVRWIADQVARCLASDDLPAAVDHTVQEVLTTPEERARFLMAVSENFRAPRDKHVAVHLLTQAQEHLENASRALTQELAGHFVAVGQPALALDMLVDQTLAALARDGRPAELGAALSSAYKTTRDIERSKQEHGHELLLRQLKARLPGLRELAGQRVLSMVEIGTTRESVPGQGSTRRLAEYCHQQGMAFITVDMDPQNGRSAQRLFDRLGMPFEAVTMKGEDYLRQRVEPVDFVFLDAYDFDHGMHSELRQSRYERFLGSRIDEQACHQMHLECAESLLTLLSPIGLVCVDDTWLDKGRWTAKGTLAMPFLLANGFELIEARNRAALLRRVPAA